MGVFAIVVLVLAAALVVSSLAVRNAPNDLSIWHVDPMTAQRADVTGQYLLRPQDGDAISPVFPGTPEDVLERLDKIAMATERTQRLAGSVAEGKITYITRSRGFGFPDYTSVKTYRAKQGSGVAMFARQRFGSDDFGVNQARVESWIAQLEV